MCPGTERRPRLRFRPSSALVFQAGRAESSFLSRPLGFPTAEGTHITKGPRHRSQEPAASPHQGRRPCASGAAVACLGTHTSCSPWTTCLGVPPTHAGDEDPQSTHCDAWQKAEGLGPGGPEAQWVVSPEGFPWGCLPAPSERGREGDTPFLISFKFPSWKLGHSGVLANVKGAGGARGLVSG